MATNKASAPAGPIPFKDVVMNNFDLVATIPADRRSLEDDGDVLVSTLPSKLMAGSTQHRLRCYQGFWLPETFVPAAIGLQRRFVPRADDVIIASLPRCGTTWLNALAFATMARRSYPPAGADHPLLRLSPHQCVLFLDVLFAGGRQTRRAPVPSPRLMYTHMPHEMLPRASGCRVVYICREPKDTAVSLWQFRRSMRPELSFADTFESVCGGDNTYGPFWDHVLGYWRASGSWPESVLFLRYEEVLRDPAENVRKLARFVGLPFSEAEEEAGVVRGIVDLCSLESLRSLEVNRTGCMDGLKFPRKALFRKGVAGDWVNHMTPEMARRMDEIVADKFSASGLSFQ